jgi:hypothetical protein
LQELLFQRGHVDPELAGHFKDGETIDTFRKLPELAAARTKMRTECTLVTAPTDQRRNVR